MDSAFKMTRSHIDLLPEQEMYEFVESGIRGGFTFVNKHHLHVNAPDIEPSSYDASKPRHEMLYVDANNLYGHALSQLLPTSNFKWLTDAECQGVMNGFKDYNLESTMGYLLEVDLEYPSAIHEKTKDFPFCPEKMKVNETHLSEFMKDQARSVNPNSKSNKTYEKLLLTQFNKTKYTVHGRLLQFYLRQGMKLTKVHRGLSFNQTFVFRDYIDYNSRMRQQATSEFEKDYFKLKNNSLYGKMVENIRRRMNFYLVNDRERYLELVSKPSFLRSIIFNENLCGVKLAKEMVTLNKPVAIGQAVLDLAKLEMYELYYDKLKAYEQELQCNISVVGGDTDSFFLSVTNCNVYETLLPAMQRDLLLDSSNFDPSHPLYSNALKAQLGCIKDESAGHPYLDWVLLKPKAYSMKCTSAAGSKKRAKGVKRASVRGLCHEDYVRAFQDQRNLSLEQRRFASSHHHMQTLIYDKQSLSFYEDKRYWSDIDISLPYGHHSLHQRRPDPKITGLIPMPIVIDDEEDRAPAVEVVALDRRQRTAAASMASFLDDSEADVVAGPSPKRRKITPFALDQAGVDGGRDDSDDEFE